MGATLPLAFHALKRDVEGVGAKAGMLLSWNAAGNLVGGLVGGFLIFRWLGNGEVFLVGLGLAAVTAPDWPRSGSPPESGSRRRCSASRSSPSSWPSPASTPCASQWGPFGCAAR